MKIPKEQELRAFITGFLTDPAHDKHTISSMTAQVFRIALAAMDAEPVAWDYEWASYITCEGPQGFKRVIERVAPPAWAIDEGQARNITPLFAAPPALTPTFHTDAARFLPECLKPEEISGDARNSRIAELMGWFDRYYSGKANPKWFKEHTAELCYYILTAPPASVVSDEMPCGGAENEYQDGYQAEWNACRAAMLNQHEGK